MTVSVTYANSNVKPEFVANTWTSADQYTPTTVGLADGGFVTAYNNFASSGNFILVDFYGPDHHSRGQYQVPYNIGGGTKAGGQPTVTQLANGNVLVAWDDNDTTDVNGSGLRGAIYTSAGQPVATDIPLTVSLQTYAEPSIAALAGGGFVASMTWQGSQSGIYLKFFDDQGVGTSDLVQVAAAPGQTDSHVTALAGGQVAVTWTDTSGSQDLVQGRIFGADGVALAPAFIIGATGDNTQPSIAALHNGNFAVAYADSGWSEGGTLGNGITLEIFTPDGTNVTPGVFVHVNTAGTPDEVSPEVTVMANGFILVTWTRPFSATDADVYGRIYDQAGNPITVNGDTDEFVITGSTANDRASSVAALLGGDYVVSWEDSDASDGSGGHIGSVINELTRTVTGDGTDDTYVGDALRDGMDGGFGNDTLSGGGGDDTLVGGFGLDALDGGGGNDLIQGGADTDLLHGGEGNDRIYGASVLDPASSTDRDLIFGDGGADLVVGASGADIVSGGDGNDTLYRRNGNDLLAGDAGDDKLKGGKGGDGLEGGAGHDTLLGGGGNDSLVANTNASVDGSADGDTLNGGGGADSLFGSAGDDFMLGGLGNDVMEGHAGHDNLSGGAGKDVLTGGAGGDSLAGGADKDVFVYAAVSDSTAADFDTIDDLSNKDRIDLHLIDANTGKAGNQAFTLVSAFSHHAGELVVTFHATGAHAGTTTIEGDVDGDGTADLTIVALGDHHTFSAFTL